MLTPWKKSYEQARQHMKKQRHHFVNKGPSSQGYGFSSGHVWMWDLDYKESWALRRIDAFELWCWRLLRVPWIARSVLGVHWKDWCWSWNLNTLATWCEELAHLKRPWCWERLRAGEGDDRGWNDWMASPTQWIWVRVDSGSWWWTARPGVAKSQTPLSDWTELNCFINLC